MTENDITGLIKLRATNDAIFTGKRNSAMPAWRLDFIYDAAFVGTL